MIEMSEHQLIAGQLVGAAFAGSPLWRSVFVEHEEEHGPVMLGEEDQTGHVMSCAVVQEIPLRFPRARQ